MKPASPPIRSLVAALVFCGLGMASGTGLADRLHLDGGGVIDVSSWWVEDDTLYYLDGRGTVGLPRSMVIRIEDTDTAAPRESSPQPDVPEPNTPDPRAKTYRVPAEVVPQMKAARAALDAGSYEEAANLFEAVMLATDAEFIPARTGYAVARIALGDDALAHAVVLDSLAHSPDHPDLLELWGDLLNRDERVEDALANWQSVFRTSPNNRLRDKILKAERELQAARDYRVTASTHFNMRYDGELDEDLADSVAERLEEQYWELVEIFDHAPRQPITVVLYPQQEFRDVTQSAEWVGGIYDGKIKVPLGGLSRLTSAAAGVLIHELTHAFIHSKTRGNCPRWLHEGLAQRSSGRSLSPADRRLVVERLRDSDPADWEQAGFSYPMALSLTNYLESRGGSHALVSLLTLLGQGMDIEVALDEVFRDDYTALCRSWAMEALEGSGP